MNLIAPVYLFTSDPEMILEGPLEVQGRTVEARRAATLDELRTASAFGMGGCAVIDLTAPQFSRDRIEAWLAGGFDFPVLGLVDSADVTGAVRLMKAGAIDVLEKPVPRQELADKISELLAIGDVVHRQERSRQEIRRRLESLTPVERAVMEEVVAGRPNKSIASKLGFSLRTIELWRRNVMTKLQVESVAELVKLKMQVELTSGPHIRWNGCQCAATALS